MSCWRRLPPCLSRRPFFPVNPIQIRSIRTKRGLNPHDVSMRRDERLLKRLEAQLADVQAKIRREDEEAAGVLKDRKRRVQHGSPNAENHNEIFWENVLSSDDRRVLESHGINSLDDLSSVYDAVEHKLSQHPYPDIKSLDLKSRCAYEIFQSIPSKLHEAGHRKAAPWFGRWF